MNRTFVILVAAGLLVGCRDSATGSDPDTTEPDRPAAFSIVAAADMDQWGDNPCDYLADTIAGSLRTWGGIDDPGRNPMDAQAISLVNTDMGNLSEDGPVAIAVDGCTWDTGESQTTVGVTRYEQVDRDWVKQTIPGAKTAGGTFGVVLGENLSTSVLLFDGTKMAEISLESVGAGTPTPAFTARVVDLFRTVADTVNDTSR